MPPRKLLLFGGTGFVGSNVLCKSLQRGWKVVCATRSGIPPSGVPTLDEALQYMRSHRLVQGYTDSGSGGDDAGVVMPFESPLEFVSLDATCRSQVFQFVEDHPDAAAVVSCVGTLTRDHVEARRICGDANVNIAAAVYECGKAVQRMVLVSVEPYQESARIFNSKWFLKGYFYGKKIAERAVLGNLGDRAVVVQPGFIYGTRYLRLGEGHVPLPLWMLGRPLESVLRPLRRHGLLLPPVDVDVVSESVVRAIEVGAVTGVLDYYKLQELCAEGRQQKQQPLQESQ